MQLYTTFLYSIKISEYKIRINSDKNPLAVERNNYLSKIVNEFKNYLFGATSMVKNSNKEKYVYSGYGITFDSAGKWSFDNSTARNVIISDVDNSSSSHSGNCKNDFLILGDGPIFGVNGNFGSPKKKLSINFTETNTKFCLSLHHNPDHSCLFVKI